MSLCRNAPLRTGNRCGRTRAAKTGWCPGVPGAASRPARRTAHGAAGICVSDAGELLLISHDGSHWGFPAGRPEGAESIEDTLRREVHEEACATVVGARLLGFARSECVNGRQLGTVLVRSYWHAIVEVEEWAPRFEIRHRRLVPATEAKKHLSEPDPVATRISYRALAEAGLG